MRILICGGGVVGACLAYFLSRRKVNVTVVERTGVACAASGKSGGFLALDWCDGTPLAPLARRSFALHAELADHFPDWWGYRRLDTLSVIASARRKLPLSGSRPPDWLGPRALIREQLGSIATTAQIDPARFTRGMVDAAIGQGARLQIGRVEDIRLSPDGGRVAEVIVDGKAIAVDAVVIAMGPWSRVAARWLPLPMVYGLKGHSVILQNPAPISPHALFVECETASGGFDSPEVFPRADGTTYVCGLSSEMPLPDDPAAVVSSEDAKAKLRAMIDTFAPILAAAPVVASQACYRPVTSDGLPLIGAVPGIAGAFVATGHSVWGMLNAPATGEAMAELLLEGKTHKIDISSFDPGRLPVVAS